MKSIFREMSPTKPILRQKKHKILNIIPSPMSIWPSSPPQTPSVTVTGCTLTRWRSPSQCSCNWPSVSANNLTYILGTETSPRSEKFIQPGLSNHPHPRAKPITTGSFYRGDSQSKSSLASLTYTTYICLERWKKTPFLNQPPTLGCWFGFKIWRGLKIHVWVTLAIIHQVKFTHEIRKVQNPIVILLFVSEFMSGFMEWQLHSPQDKKGITIVCPRVYNIMINQPGFFRTAHWWRRDRSFLSNFKCTLTSWISWLTSRPRWISNNKNHR